MEEYLPKLKSVISELEKDLDAVSKSVTFDEVSEAEKRGVAGIRTITMLSNKVGWDLYNRVNNRRRDISEGKIEAPKEEKKTEEKPKVKKVVKRTAKSRKAK